LQVAEELSSHFPGGAYFVPLATVSDPGLILPLIAQTVGVKDTRSPAVDALKNYLNSLRSPVLLLLDNFEHLIAGAQSVAELLTLGANLKVLVTSREPLHVYGEYEFPVPPLALPDLKRLPPLEELSQYSAVALFKERAEAVNPNFELTEENASAVAEICERLDGLPLAIELAAARVKLLSPAAMHQRLSSRLQLLTGGAKERPARQQTLRGAIDWSYNLLNEAEQKLFSRLSVFVGGCTLEGVEAVCNTNGDLGLDPLDGMESMVDKSLVRRVEHVSGESRFAMLETIREYGWEKLAASDEEQLIRRAHAAYHLVLAEEAAEAPDAESGEWQERLKLESDNIRAALKWLVRNGNAEWGLRFGAALFRFWQTGEYLSEGRQSLAQLLKLGDPLPSKVRARALFAAGVLAGEQGDHDAADPLLKESMNISQTLGDRHGQAASLNALAVHARHRGDIGTARALLEESLKLWREIGDQLAIARALSNLANFVKMQGDFETARSLYEDSLSIFRELGDYSGVAWSLNYQGDVAREQGDPEGAAKLYQQSLMTFRELGDQWGIASALTDLGNLARDQGNFAEAESLYHKSLTMFQEQEQKRGIARVLECLACSAAAQSKPERSLRLAGAASALRQVVGAALSSDEQARLEKLLEPARKALSKGTKAWMEGWALPVDKAIKEALSTD
jgi:predicted ATPase